MKKKVMNKHKNKLKKPIIKSLQKIKMMQKYYMAINNKSLYTSSLEQ